MTGTFLLEGWNLFSLSVKPPEGFSASDLLTTINQQGGMAIAVSRWHDGRWQSHLVDLDLNDFSIEVGRAYFIECRLSGFLCHGALPR